jgi:hypothetical protein
MARLGAHQLPCSSPTLLLIRHSAAGAGGGFEFEVCEVERHARIVAPSGGRVHSVRGSVQHCVAARRGSVAPWSRLRCVSPAGASTLRRDRHGRARNLRLRAAPRFKKPRILHPDAESLENYTRKVIWR